MQQTPGRRRNRCLGESSLKNGNSLQDKTLWTRTRRQVLVASAMDEILEKLRLRYKPAGIVLLLVGESPPPNKGFFYDADSPEGQLSRNTRRVFEDVSGAKFTDRKDFLNQFKRKGCYLHDLFQPRGKTMLRASRREQEAAVEKLSNLLRQGKPKTTVSVLKRTSKLVRRAIERAQIPVDYRTLPYPTRNYVTQYRSGLAAILTSFSEAPGRAHQLRPSQQ